MILQPGDILLWRVDPGAPLLDRLIGWGESKLKQRGPSGNQYYHVAFVSRNPKLMYSAQPPRLDLYPVPDPLPPYVEVYRLKDVDFDKLTDVFLEADKSRGEPYDFLGVFTMGYLEIGRLKFCSRWTFLCFLEYPVTLTPDIEYPTPDDVAGSLSLVKIAT